MSDVTFNFISQRNSIFNELSNDWVGLNAVTARSGTKIYNPTQNRNDDVNLAFYAIGINAIDHGQQFGARLSIGEIDATYNANKMQFHVAIYSESTIKVDCRLLIDDTPIIDTNPDVERLFDVVGGQWTIVRSYIEQLPDDSNPHTIDVIINTFSGSEHPIYVAIPGVISINQLFKNEFVLNVLASMPDFYYEHNIEDNSLTSVKSSAYLLERFMDLGLSAANAVLLLFLSYTRFGKEDGFDPQNPLMPVNLRSALVDPLGANETTIKWLAQFAGRPIVDARDIFASRLNFPQDDATIDENITFTENEISGVTITREAGYVYTNTASIDSSFYNGTGVIRVKADSPSDTTFDGIFILSDNADLTKLNWSQDEYDAVSSSTVTISEVSYDSVTKYASNRHSFNQYQVDSRNFGISSGTVSSLETTLNELLSGTKTYSLSYTEKWVVAIQTKLDETPTYLLSSNQFDVLDSLLSPVIPAGYIASYSQFPNEGGTRITLDEDPEGRLNLYALGNP